MMITINVSAENLVESMRDMDREDVVEVIRGIDLMVAEVDFTHDILRCLLLSLTNDVADPSKITKILKDIKKAIEEE